MKTNSDNIAYLVGQVKANDSQSFVLLFEETYQKIYFFVLIILKDHDESLAALGQIYSKVLSSIDSLKNDSLFVVWVYKVAFEVCSRLATSRLVSLSSEDGFGVKCSLDSLVLGIADDKQRSMARAVLGLDDSLRLTLVLSQYFGFLPKDIALIMSCTEGIVKRRLKAARKQLRFVLESENLLVVYSSVPIAICLGAAAGSGLGANCALTVLQKVLSDNGFSDVVDFTPHGVYKGTSDVYRSSHRRVLGAFFCSVFLMVCGVFFYAEPSILTFSSSSSEFAQELVLEFSVSSLVPVESVYLTSDMGKRIVLDDVGGKTFRASVFDNGVYTAHCVAFNKNFAQQSIVVDNIDRVSPSVEDFFMEGEVLTFVLSDSLSGVNFDRVFLLSGNRTRLEPVLFDGDKVVFHVSEDSYVLFAEDMAGNLMQSHVSIVV